MVKYSIFKKYFNVKVFNVSGCKANTRTVHAYVFDSNEEIVQNFLENVMLIGINLPASRNLLTETAVKKLCESVNTFAKTEEVSVAILHGFGGNFCTGVEPTENALEKSRDLLKALNDLKKPIIASLNGYTTDFGFNLAVMCDIRVMEETAVAGFTNRLHALELPHYALERLILNMGLAKTFEIINIQGIWSAKECFDKGFVNRHVICGCSLGQATTWAQNIARCPLSTIIEKKSKLLSSLAALTSKVQ